MLIKFSRIPGYFNLGRNGSSTPCGLSVESFGPDDDIRLQPLNKTGWLTRCMIYLPREAALQVANAILDAAGLERTTVTTTAQEFETRRTVVLSTAHIPQATWETLLALPLKDWPVSGGPTGCGAVIYAHEHSDREIDAFEGLYAPLAWARSQGFDYVMFDNDADPRDELPAYDLDQAA
ncbi:hypothetical protein [Caulobacter sp. Root343]|uniref:DUF5983 family protein n=1 Tax=Caulobacter sp. Root343 TaxID=1736520 RepID=UPI0006FFE751|nr:hypothetical protein [Caulobacter sp. Root343]KQV66663.1 hypothetical protein ASC70_12585 [Caulobacter sp. Root343]